MNKTLEIEILSYDLNVLLWYTFAQSTQGWHSFRKFIRWTLWWIVMIVHLDLLWCAMVAISFPLSESHTPSLQQFVSFNFYLNENMSFLSVAFKRKYYGLNFLINCDYLWNNQWYWCLFAVKKLPSLYSCGFSCKLNIVFKYAKNTI